MKQKIALYFMTGILLTSQAGCSFLRNNFASAPAEYSQELVYDRAVDFTYLTALDAVNELPNWDIYFNDKAAGKISVTDSRYMDALNPDSRVVTILVKPLGRDKTSIALDEESKGKLNAGELLKAIDSRITQVLQAQAVTAAKPTQAT